MTHPEIESKQTDSDCEDGVALCLSGGGFKAATYHTGALIRLNEVGALHDLKRISSVSGGSIAAGLLGLLWEKFDWQTKDGVTIAHDFIDRFAKPLLNYCASEKLDVGAGAGGLFWPFKSGAERIAASYRKRLYGEATLQDLPSEGECPRFVYNATNMGVNSLFRFSRKYAADNRIGRIDTPDFSLAKVVAASSGFPPFFSPAKFDLSRCDVQPMTGTDLHGTDHAKIVSLADGGVYDNLGLEAIWKRYETLIVCNAGDPTKEAVDPPKNWAQQMRRTVSFMHRQAENNRIRWLMDLAKTGERHVVYIPLRGSAKSFGDPNALSLSDKDAQIAMEEGVRLWPLKPDALQRLVRHGYSMASASLSRWLPGYDPNTAPTPRWPEF